MFSLYSNSTAQLHSETNLWNTFRQLQLINVCVCECICWHTWAYTWMNVYADILVLWMQRLYFQKELLVLVRKKMGLTEVSGRSFRDIVSKLSCQSNRSIRTLHVKNSDSMCFVQSFPILTVPLTQAISWRRRMPSTSTQTHPLQYQ